MSVHDVRLGLIASCHLSRICGTVRKTGGDASQIDITRAVVQHGQGFTDRGSRPEPMVIVLDLFQGKNDRKKERKNITVLPSCLFY